MHSEKADYKFSPETLYLLFSDEEIIVANPSNYLQIEKPSETDKIIAKPSSSEVHHQVIVCISEERNEEKEQLVSKMMAAVGIKPHEYKLIFSARTDMLMSYKSQVKKAFWTFGLEHAQSHPIRFLVSAQPPFHFAFPELSRVAADKELKRAIWEELKQMIN